ncbi:apyrase-like [Leguminivora glycinivorella]|uniref:apyrase-like n=1 Tax=Leguminivora glycinivorella TaxID=1035111 RepID=UPI00200D2B33|nr:apyrase-like [Leguminivora glycinivorella]
MVGGYRELGIKKVLATTGKLLFTDEVEVVRHEAEKLNEQGIDIIVVLSHCGIEIDREIALHGGPYIDIIVGGHSHTLLYNEDPPANSAFVPQGPYPVVVEQETRQVLIVQAAAHTQYLGEIKLFFDDAGNLLEWAGNPHYLGNEVAQAPDVLEKLAYYLPQVDELARQEVGSSMVHLDSSCACGECNLGSFICDAFMHAALPLAQEGTWNYAHFCVINRGAIRVDIEPGTITFESMLLSTPFENNVEVFQLRGDHIMEMLEFSVANEPYNGARMLQVSGIQTVFDGSRPKGNRLVSAIVRCVDCDVPRYENLVPGNYYRVITSDFIGAGGGNFTMISENRFDVEVIGVDYDVIQDYIQHQSPIFKDLDGRVEISNPCSD